MFNDGRFSGAVGEEYDIFYDAVPHILELHAEAGVLIKKYINSRWPKDFTGPIMIYEGGCGAGTTTDVLLNLDKRIHVVAIDNEELMLRKVKERFKNYSDRVTFIHDDILHAVKGFKNVDIFVSGFMIHNMQPDYRKSLFEELGKVVNSGGFLVNLDKIARDDEALHKQDYEAELELLKYFLKIGRPELTKQWTDHYVEDDKIRFTEKEQTDSLVAAGFKDISFPSRRLFDAICTALKS